MSRNNKHSDEGHGEHAQKAITGNSSPYHSDCGQDKNDEVETRIGYERLCCHYGSGIDIRKLLAALMFGFHALYLKYRITIWASG